MRPMPVLATIAALALAAPASAMGLTGFHRAERPLSVRTDGLDLASPQAARVLELRLNRAVRDHCLGDHPLPHRMLTLDYLVCFDETRASAWSEIAQRLSSLSARPLPASQ